MRTTVSSENFYNNFLQLKQKMREPLPTDKVILKCNQCKENVTLNKDGVIRFDTMLTKEISSVMDSNIQTMIQTHKKQSDICVSANVLLHPILENPANILVSVPESETKYINCFKIGSVSYKVDIIITTVDVDQKIIFIL